jgi:transcriptional regulator with XRE-family HTH domain
MSTDPAGVAGDAGADLARLRRGLCRSLRQHREHAGLTQREAADALDWSISKLVRVERGTTSVRVTDVQAMLRLYEVTGEDEITRLTGAARSLWRRPDAARRHERPDPHT